MNISKINANTTSFGSIKKSAVEKAIKQADGDISKLRSIKTLIEDQKSNPYDIKGLPSHEYYNFIVIKPGSHSGMCYMTLEESCSAAVRAAEADKLKETRETEKLKNKPEADRIINDLLNSCEDT